VKTGSILRYAKFIPDISLMKTLYYSCRFHGPVIVGKGARVIIRKKGRIRFSENSSLFIGLNYNFPPHTLLEIDEYGTLEINGHVSFLKGTKIDVEPNALLSIGDGSSIGEQSKIKCSRRINIGKNCAISWNVNITDTDGHELTGGSARNEKTKEITIKDNAWIGFNSIILKGVTIGSNSVIGAGTVVTKDTPDNSLVAGNPGRLIKTGISWKP
jgi:acetyltransferase-like isoleucine patch superfamily enzyme